MGLSKSDLVLQARILTYLQNNHLTIMDSHEAFHKPQDENDYPKVIKNGEIIIEQTDTSPPLTDLLDGIRALPTCQYARIRKEVIHAYTLRVLYPERTPGKTYSWSELSAKSRSIIELVKISYDA